VPAAATPRSERCRDALAVLQDYDAGVQPTPADVQRLFGRFHRESDA
jgi:hypothetical protein